MPIAFAQVREDSLVDLELLDQLPNDGLRGIMIASGGCTAAMLAASGRLSRLHLVDVNPAQLALCRLKLHLLRTAAPSRRLELLGHAPLDSGERRQQLATALAKIGLSPAALGSPTLVAGLGPDYAGRYEMVFTALRREMAGHCTELGDTLCLKDHLTRAARVAPDAPLGEAIDLAFERAMALPNLIVLFGADATRNAREPFSRHFARRTREAIASPMAHANPYLWQLLLGQFPEHVVYPWLTAPASRQMPEIIETPLSMDSALANSGGGFHFVHLSNILDWLSAEQAARTLQLAFDACMPGGLVIIRQLNSTLDIPGLCDKFEWLIELADDMHSRDRSFIYRALHVGRKP